MKRAIACVTPGMRLCRRRGENHPPCSHASTPCHCHARLPQVLFAPTEDEIAAGYGFQFGIRYTDKVYPVCHEGVNRSQVRRSAPVRAPVAATVAFVLVPLSADTLRELAAAQVTFLVAQGIMRKLGNHFYNVERPHGAETGFDPHAGFTSVTEDNYYEFTHGAMLGPEAPSEWQHRCACPLCTCVRGGRGGSTVFAHAVTTCGVVALLNRSQVLRASVRDSESAAGRERGGQ